MTNIEKPQNKYCTLCGRTRQEAGRLVHVKTHGVQICRRCTDKCLEIFEETAKQNWYKPSDKIANGVLLRIKQMVEDSSYEYARIVDEFEQSTMNTESIAENKKNKIRMDALEIRCKDSQLLLEQIIALFNTKGEGQIKIKEYENKVSGLLSNIRNELNKNNLLGMTGYLEKIPIVMSEIGNNIRFEMQKISKTSATTH